MLLAYAFLVGICVQDQQTHPSPEQVQPPTDKAVGIEIQDQQAHPAAEQPAPCSPLIALTTSEVRHLLARLIWPAPSSALLICHWSYWRRAHQYWAGYYHRRRRLKASSV